MINEDYKEDVIKVYNEINQILNQRFLLTTGAITLFAAVLSWLGMKDIKPETDQKIILFPTSLLFLFLLLLFIYKYFLSKTIATLSAYLIATEQSKWEGDFDTFRNDKDLKHDRQVGFEFVENSIFFILGIIVFVMPLVFKKINEMNHYWDFWLHIIIGVIYILCTGLMGLYGWGHRKKQEIIDEWKSKLKIKNSKKEDLQQEREVIIIIDSTTK